MKNSHLTLANLASDKFPQAIEKSTFSSSQLIIMHILRTQQKASDKWIDSLKQIHKSYAEPDNHIFSYLQIHKWQFTSPPVCF